MSEDTFIASSPPSPSDITAAAQRLAEVAVHTPLLQFPTLDAQIGGTCLIKPEMLQRTGSFKFRGAYNKIAGLPDSLKQRGVVAFSSGNHAQGVAHAAQRHKIPAIIVMPSDAPKIKIESTKAYGAEVRLYDRYFEHREAVAAEIMAETGATLIKPYDDPDIVAGQGTCGREIAKQARELGLNPDIVLICCGGGGLTAGTAIALHDANPSTEIYTVEPVGFDDHARSLREGRRVQNPEGPISLCDALLAPTPGEFTFAINQSHLTGGLAVTDTETERAVSYAYRNLKLVVEPGGAVSLAAVLANKLPLRGRTIVIVLTGGNVDPGLFCRIVNGTALKDNI